MQVPIHVATVGRPAAIYRSAVEHYLRLLSPFAAMKLRHTRSGADKNAAPARAMNAEASALRALLPTNGHVVALAADGRRFDSHRFAGWLDARRRERAPTVFVIGGAYGLAPRLTAASDETLSLSSLTLSHDIALVVLLEQIYRAFTILYGHPYHK